MTYTTPETSSQSSPTERPTDSSAAPIVIVGSGLAGMVAAYEALQGGKQVVILDQENRNNLGGQAFWSLGGLFYVGSPEQKLMRVSDSYELAWRDWENSADYDDAPHDRWPKAWGQAYVQFAAGEKREYLKKLGLNVLPTIGWAERGSGDASGHGNSVPRFHLTWGTGPEVVRVFREPLERAEATGQLTWRFRHRVEGLLQDESGRVTGVRGVELTAEDALPRGQASSRKAVREFQLNAASVVIATGGIGGNLAKVRASWPSDRWGPCPDDLVAGVPAHVDGSGIDVAKHAGANLVNTDRMWHYPEGMHNWDSIWPQHGIRIIPGPSSLWLDATGKRLPTNLFPGSDNLAALSHIGKTGHGYSWFLLNSTIADKEFIFSGSEQNPDLTQKTIRQLASKLGPKTHPAVQAFKDHGVDWVIADNLDELTAKMAALADDGLLDRERVARTVADRDSQLDNPFSKDAQVNYLRTARKFLGDKIVRAAAPHKLADAKHGPLIAVRLQVLTRKTLGGLETDLSGRCLDSDGNIIPGLFACGEAAGFGGGGMHGKNALEGTFLGGCIHSGKRVGEALARDK